MTEWIICSERLPEVSVRVLWRWPGLYVFIGYLEMRPMISTGLVITPDDSDTGIILTTEATEWQPLPAI